MRHYIYEILKGVNFCHSNGIMHRDLKPQNIVYDVKTKELKIIDWGLAEFYFPAKEFNVRVSTRYYKVLNPYFPIILFQKIKAY